MREGVRMARAKDVAKLLRGGVNDKTGVAPGFGLHEAVSLA